VTAALAFVFLSDRPGVLGIAGITSAVLGVVLISRAPPHPDNLPAKDVSKGLVSAILCCLGYGVFYFALKYAVADLGVLTAAAYVRVVGVAALAFAALLGVAPVHRLPRSFVPALVVVGLFDSGAFIAYNVGIALGSVAIVGTLSGLFSAVTVGLAVLFLRERLVTVQYVGLAAIFVGIVLIAVS
jgi:drug/metabolite transporter (DMT)-like permease